MTEDEEKVEEPTTEGEISPDETSTEPEEKVAEPEEPCDPLTMNCDEMRDKIIGLSTKRTTLEMGIKSIDDTRKIIPSSELDTAYDEAVKKREKVDDEIYNTFERFTVCTTKPEEETEEESKEEPEEEEPPEEKTEET